MVTKEKQLPYSFIFISRPEYSKKYTNNIYIITIFNL